MQSRRIGQVARNLAKGFSFTKNYTYFRQPLENFHQRATLIPGVFIGPEITNSVLDCLKACNTPVEFDIISDFNIDSEECRDRLRKNKVLLVGNLGKVGSRYLDNTKCYKALDLSVHIVQVSTLPNIHTRHKNVDLVVVRENLEGEFSGIEHEVYPGVFESLKVITKAKTQVVTDFAFQHALLTGRKKVTCVHKANIMKMVDGLFLECARESAKKHPEIQYEEMIVDNTCMQLVKTPQQFDLMVMPNLYGSITQAISAGLVGGAGVTAASSFGKEFMMFEPGTRVSGNRLTGLDIANPTGLILASTNMLMNMGLQRFGAMIKQALKNVYFEGKYLTKDVGGKSHASDFTKRMVEEIKFLDSGKVYTSS